MTKAYLQSTEDPTRRSLIKVALCAIPLLIGGTLAASVSTYLFGKRPEGRKDTWVDAGDISDIEVDTPYQVRFEQVVIDGWKVRNQQSSAWVILDGQRSITAFSPLCTHLGCAYRWELQKEVFACPCHGSNFNLRGEVVAGPASRPLDRYMTKLEDKRLWLGPLQNSQGS